MFLITDTARDAYYHLLKGLCLRIRGYRPTIEDIVSLAIDSLVGNVHNQRCTITSKRLKKDPFQMVSFEGMDRLGFFGGPLASSPKRSRTWHAFYSGHLENRTYVPEARYVNVGNESEYYFSRFESRVDVITLFPLAYPCNRK